MIPWSKGEPFTEGVICPSLRPFLTRRISRKGRLDRFRIQQLIQAQDGISLEIRVIPFWLTIIPERLGRRVFPNVKEDWSLQTCPVNKGGFLLVFSMIDFPFRFSNRFATTPEMPWWWIFPEKHLRFHSFGRSFSEPSGKESFSSSKHRIESPRWQRPAFKKSVLNSSRNSWLH